MLFWRKVRIISVCSFYLFWVLCYENWTKYTHLFSVFIFPLLVLCCENWLFKFLQEFSCIISFKNYCSINLCAVIDVCDILIQVSDTVACQYDATSDSIWCNILSLEKLPFSGLWNFDYLLLLHFMPKHYLSVCYKRNLCFIYLCFLFSRATLRDWLIEKS